MRGVPPVGTVVQPARHVERYWRQRLADRETRVRLDPFDDQPTPIGVVSSHHDGSYRGYVAGVTFLYTTGGAEEFLLRRGETAVRRDLKAHRIDRHGRTGWVVTGVDDEPTAPMIADMMERLNTPACPPLDEILERTGAVVAEDGYSATITAQVPDGLLPGLETTS